MSKDTDDPLYLTLKRGMSQWMATEVDVSPGEGDDDTHWRRVSFLGDCFPAGVIFHPGLGPGPRRFLKRHLAQPSSTSRRLLASAVATWQTAPLGGLWKLSSPMMTMEPDRPEWRHLLVLPQAQRVRVLDFERAVSRVFLRVGEPPEALMLDVVARFQEGIAPFPRLRATDPEGLWYEEDLVDGVPLSLSTLKEEVKEGLVSECLRRLERWQQSDERRVPVEEYVSGLVERIGSLVSPGDLSEREAARFTARLEAVAAMASPGSAPEAATTAAPDAAPDAAATPAPASGAVSLDTVGLVFTHGGVSRENVLVGKDATDPVLVGKADAKERSRRFDRMFYRLGAGDVEDLGQRCASGAEPAWFAALFFLEAIERLLARAHRTEGSVSAGLAEDLIAEMQVFLDESA